MSHKWHYFNENEDFCVGKWYPPFSSTPGTFSRTACQIDVEVVQRHTEYEEGVTCKKCIQALAKLTERGVKS